MTEFTSVAPDALKEHVGKRLPVIIEIDGEKKTIGESIVIETAQGLELKSEIDEGYAGLFRDKSETFSFQAEGG